MNKAGEYPQDEVVRVGAVQHAYFGEVGVVLTDLDSVTDKVELSAPSMFEEVLDGCADLD